MEPIVSLDNSSGFTLIEFCIAVVIMTVGILGLLQAVNVATEQNTETFLRNEAISVADEQMVLTKASVYDLSSFTNLETNITDTVKFPPRVQRKARGWFANYSVNRTITTGSINSKEVAVRVSWRYKGKKVNHVISSLVTNPSQ